MKKYQYFYKIQKIKQKSQNDDDKHRQFRQKIP